MNIDMAALHAIEADKGITVDVVVDTIKSALLTAYRHTEGHEADARIEIDRKTGGVQVLASYVGRDFMTAIAKKDADAYWHLLGLYLGTFAIAASSTRSSGRTPAAR